jgi:hypothetical protein
MKAYVEYTKHLEAPDTFHLWASVATLAGALRGKCWIDMGYFKWKPNFFIIFVAPPGVVSKSTTVGVGMSMLREVEGIHFGPDSATWQALTQAFSESTEMVDTGHGDMLPMSAITISASELGTFLDPTNREMIDVLVDLWDGRDVPWTRHTKSEGESTIANPWLNFVGCTTPAWIEGNFPEYAIGGGFTSRTIFVYAENKRHLQAYPKSVMSPEFALLHKALVADLKLIANVAGEYILTDEATTWGEKWYEEHWASKHSHLAGDRFGGYIARKQTHVHKLALIISAAQRDETIITLEDLQVADQLVSALEHNLPSVFNRISDNRDAKYSAAVFAVLRTEHVSSKQKLWQKVYHLMSNDQFELALTGIVKAGYAKVEQKGTDLEISLTGQGKLPQSHGKDHGTSLRLVGQPSEDVLSDSSPAKTSPSSGE